MDGISRTELKTLLEMRNGPCVSIYVPVIRAGGEVRQNQVRTKNLLASAEQQLLQNGMRALDAADFIRRGHDLNGDYRFWERRGDGLAMFGTKEWFRGYHLPIEVPELAVVAKRFHLKPLLPLILSDERFYILALSQNQVRLFHVFRHRTHEVPLPKEVPTSLAEALRYDDPEKQQQYHTGVPGRQAVFHGHGFAGEVDKDNLLRYCQQIDNGLKGLLAEEHVPLILAGVDYLLAIYRQVNSYPHLVKEEISGSPDREHPEQLHTQARGILEPYFKEARRVAEEEFYRLQGTGYTSTGIMEVLPAAVAGRVAVLFTPMDKQLWGRYDPFTGQVEIHPEEMPGDEDLLDLAAVQTYLHGGTVYAVEPAQMPNGEPVAAVYRY